jgi:GcrA cell cycle regulator
VAERVWTDERIAEAKRLYIDEGYSAAQVAVAIGAVSRNAVIGKMMRMGYTRSPELAAINNANRCRPVGEVAKRVPKAARRKFQPTVPGWKNEGPVAPTRHDPRGAPVESPNAKVWTERLTGQCAYPVDGEGADVRSCCNPTEGGTYCQPHSRVMYAPTTKLNTYGIEVGGRKSRAKAGISDSIFAKWAA